ncbi:recombinase family protein [Endozoicomonas ascidiicola]|uniref:recombinase family protein n=1 Tax=Endozoicomonas ascidiicola TaxID=1698521 RepID=UPI003451B5C1
MSQQQKKKSVIYLRVSTDKQAEKELPLESQLEQCEKKALELGATVEQIFKDEGLSARNDNRPAFQAALAYCENLDIDYFICWSTSRFARNRLEAQLNKRRLTDSGTEVAYVTVNIEKSGSGILQEGMLELFDEYLSYQVGADTRRSMIKNAKHGFWNGGNAPYGFKSAPSPADPKRKSLVQVPTETLLIEQIFKLREEGMGAKSIALILNEQGSSNRGKRWTKTSVYSVLKSEKVAGMTTFNKRAHNGTKNPPEQWITVDSHDGIISKDRFVQVQKLIDGASPKGNAGSAKSTRLFTGIVQCGRCKENMVITSATGRSSTYYYYECQSRSNGSGCDTKHKRISAGALDNFLLDTIAARIFTRENLTELIMEINDLAGNWVKENRRKKRTLLAESEKLRTRNRRLYEFLEDPEGPANLGDLIPRLRENNQKIKELEAELERLSEERPPEFEITDGMVEEVSDFFSGMMKEQNNPKKLRQFLSSVLDEIVVGEEEIKISYDPAVIIDSAAVHSRKKWLPELDSNQRPND